MARGGQQVIPRPEGARPGAANPWLGRVDPNRLTIDRAAAVLALLEDGLQPETLPTTPMRPPFLSTTRDAAVLIPLYTGSEGELRVLLTRRSGRLRNHKGEVAFPGGRIDAGEGPVEAALREAKEEVALPPHHVEVIGALEPLTTLVSASRITPFVAWVPAMHELRDGLVPDAFEVDRIFDVSLAELASPECYREEIWDFADGTFPVWFFEVEDDTIWGATGRMLRRLLDLLLLS